MRIIYTRAGIPATEIHQYALGGHLLHVESNTETDTVVTIAIMSPEELGGGADQADQTGESE